MSAPEPMPSATPSSWSWLKAKSRMNPMASTKSTRRHGVSNEPGEPRPKSRSQPERSSKATTTSVGCEASRSNAASASAERATSSTSVVPVPPGAVMARSE